MSRLRVESLTLPTAPVGDSNPLPPLFAGTHAHEVSDPGDADQEMRRGLAYGRVRGPMPYLLQDGYDRHRTDVEHRVGVLENDVLRAEFLLGAGGRLWSLVHRPSGRELLHRNPVFQPANLALRNAWFAGGVEWNIGTIGHSVTTCAPLHAVRVERPDGAPALRMYEYERIRGVVFQIDAWLPDDSPVLLVHVRIVNPSEDTVPMYWWSNIAVPQTPDVRVLAPADSAWHPGHDGGLRRVGMPVGDGVDVTYTSRATRAADYFFAIEDGERRWIAALDGAGTGLAQTSTDLLRGRKLFMWGRSPGGDHWQEWLSGPTREYLEVQAGLARTQLEHLPMPPKATWAWVEAYGLVTCDAAAVHGGDWRRATAAARQGVDALVPRERLDAALEEATAWIDDEPVEVLQAGSGWGALERIRRSRLGDETLTLRGAPFADDTLGPEQEPWLALLDGASLLPGTPDRPPPSYQCGGPWLTLLRGLDGWNASLHRGVMLAAAGDLDGAEAEWTSSLADRPTAWAWRNLGALAREQGDLPLAVRRYRESTALAGDLPALTLELLEVLLSAGRHTEALRTIGDAPADDRSLGRLRFAEARAALGAGDLERVGTLLDSGLVVPDIREGESSLHELWFGYQAARRA
ncbi:MAG: DUF5107 domain-containing protein, partial [Nocardioidaceae bacterium]